MRAVPGNTQTLRGAPELTRCQHKVRIRRLPKVSWGECFGRNNLLPPPRPWQGFQPGVWDGFWEMLFVSGWGLSVWKPRCHPQTRAPKARLQPTRSDGVTTTALQQPTSASQQADEYVSPLDTTSIPSCSVRLGGRDTGAGHEALLPAGRLFHSCPWNTSRPEMGQGSARLNG